MKKVLTIILDGFGLRNAVHGNAVKLAKMPNFKIGRASCRERV